METVAVPDSSDRIEDTHDNCNHEARAHDLGLESEVQRIFLPLVDGRLGLELEYRKAR